MNWHVLVALFETVVLLNVMQVVSPDNHGSVHLHFGDNTGENTSTDGNFADEWALFVNVITLASLFDHNEILDCSSWLICINIKNGVNSLCHSQNNPKEIDTEYLRKYQLNFYLKLISRISLKKHMLNGKNNDGRKIPITISPKPTYFISQFETFIYLGCVHHNVSTHF